MLNEKQVEVLQLHVEGENITNISKITGVTRQSIYNWMKDEEFKEELDKALDKAKSDANYKVTTKLPNYIDELSRLALTAKSEKIRSDTLMYLVDRVLGKSTTKIENIGDNNLKKDNKSDRELSWDDLKEDNLLKLKFKE